jgi:hypothetical protein
MAERAASIGYIWSGTAAPPDECPEDWSKRLVENKTASSAESGEVEARI